MLDAGGPDSLQSRVQKLDAALVALADTPESPVNREEAVAAASGVARKLNMLSGEVVRLRADLDAEIARQVAQVNAAVKRIEGLNREIEAAQATGQDATGLEDERQRQVDIVNRIVPIRSSPDRGPGRLMSAAGGGVLADTNGVPLAFETTAATDGTGPMGGLRLGPSDATPPGSALLGGGSLEALFRARDAFAPDMASKLDAAAADFVTRFQDLPGWTAAVSGEGLFVDGSAGYLAAGAPTAGLAGRIAVNADLDPAAGGNPALIAGGAFGGRTDPADAASYPALLREAMQARPADGATPARQSATAAIAALGAGAEAAAARAETEAGFARGAAAALRDTEIGRQGVDTDAELRDLLVIERAYAANARVLQAVDDMMRRLLEI